MNTRIWPQLALVLCCWVWPAPDSPAARLLGIDVSSWQQTIDWPSVASAGITFAWAKATEGTGLQDA